MSFHRHHNPAFIYSTPCVCVCVCVFQATLLEFSTISPFPFLHPSPLCATLAPFNLSTVVPLRSCPLRHPCFPCPLPTAAFILFQSTSHNLKPACRSSEFCLKFHSYSFRSPPSRDLLSAVLDVSPQLLPNVPNLIHLATLFHLPSYFDNTFTTCKTTFLRNLFAPTQSQNSNFFQSTYF